MDQTNISEAGTVNTVVNQPTLTSHETTDFALVTGKVNEPAIFKSNLDSLKHVQDTQSIIDFLRKPIFVQGVTFATTNNRGDVLYAHNPGNTIQGGLAYPAWTNKLAGIYTISATAVYDIVINATPFHAGGILLNYRPMEQTCPGLYAAHDRDLCGKSQKPGALLCNINQDHYTYKIPYLAPTEMFDLTDTSGRFPDWGSFRLTVWSPLAVGASGANSITISVFMHWEDVILGPAYTQSSGHGRKRVTFGQRWQDQLRSKDEVKYIIEFLNEINYFDKPIKCQAKGMRKHVGVVKVSPLAKEKQSAAPDSLSSTMSTISHAAGTLAQIPSLSAIAAPAAWVADVASNVASYFGFSKPVSDAGIMRQVNMLGQYANNGSGSDDSIVHATQHDAGHSIIKEKTIYDADEMAIDFIKTRSAYLRNISFATTAVPGDQIDRFDIVPLNWYTSVAYDTITLKQYTPVGILCSLFEQYTGGFKVKIKFWKTAFHAGTLAFTFVPGYNTAATYTLDNTITANRYIVDLQTTDEIVMTLPYQLPWPNARVFDKFGSLYVHAITPLRAPETVSQSIDITYEVMGNDDLQFFNPKQFSPNVVMCQGATEDVNEESQVTIGSSKEFGDPISVASDCVGEHINSIKQLLNRNCRLNCTLDFQVNPAFWVRPHGTTAQSWVASTHSTVTPSIFGDYYSFFSFFYLFRRGSVRWRLYRYNTGVGFLTKEISYPPSALIGDYTTSVTPSEIVNSNQGTLYGYMKSTITEFTGTHLGCAIQVPMQGYGSVIPNDPTRTVGVNPQVGQPPLCVTFKSTGTGNDLTIGRSAGDDFQNIFWIGCPLVTDGAI